MLFACSFNASDSVGMIFAFAGADALRSSMRWKEVRMSPPSRVGTKRSPYSLTTEMPSDLSPSVAGRKSRDGVEAEAAPKKRFVRGRIRR